MQELARAIGEAWEPAKKRGVNDKEDIVYKTLNGGRCPATLLLVKFLQDNDDAFQPGGWFPSSKFAKVKSTTAFDRKILEVQGKVSGWTWESWRS